MKPMTMKERGFYLTIFSFGFICAMTTKSWWGLLNAIVTILVIWIIFAISRKLSKVYGIGSKEVEKLQAKSDKYGWNKKD